MAKTLKEEIAKNLYAYDYSPEFWDSNNITEGEKVAFLRMADEQLETIRSRVEQIENPWVTHGFLYDGFESCRKEVLDLLK